MEFPYSRYEEAANKYLPEKTRVLFVAEAPPLCIDRYFYFEDVKRDDWLWIALMKELFLSEWGTTACERKRKRHWLLKFQNNGYQLIDAVKRPISGTPAARVKNIEAGSRELILEIKKIKPNCIVLIKATVHEALFEEFKSAHLPVMNKKPLPFPSSGRQKEFHLEFRRTWLDCT